MSQQTPLERLAKLSELKFQIADHMVTSTTGLDDNWRKICSLIFQQVLLCVVREDATIVRRDLRERWWLHTEQKGSRIGRVFPLAAEAVILSTFILIR